ncbi:MAG TPA: ABC transporter substrate-binding protein, partial [Limnochordia bacterium]
GAKSRAGVFVGLILIFTLAVPMAAAEREAVTLQFWNGWGGTRIPLMEQMLERFMQKYPWIQVENQVIGLGNDRIEKLTLAVAAGAPPDVAMIDRVDIPAFVAEGMLEPLDPFIARDRLDLGIFYEPEISLAQFEGRTWALPIPTAGAKQLMFYHMDLFREAGLDPAAPPRTWTELEAAARKLTIRQGDGLVQAGINPLSVSDASWDFWLYNNNGAVLSPDGRRVAFDDARGRQTMRWLVDFHQRINGGSAMLATLGGGFIQRKLAMQIAGSWEWYNFRRQDPSLELAIALPPHGEGATSVNPISRGWGYAIPAGADHPYESWLLIKYLTTEPEAACWFMIQQGRPSPLKQCNLAPEMRQSNPYLDVIGEILVHGVQVPITPVHTRFFELVARAQADAISGRLAPDAAIESAAREAQALLDEAYGLR